MRDKDSEGSSMYQGSSMETSVTLRVKERDPLQCTPE